jgi:exosortase/archaeosortase family protein
MTAPLVEPGDRRTALLRTGIVGVATLAALPFTFRALVEDYRYGAMLGELAFVPLCAFGLALAAAHRHSWITRLRAGRADHVLAGVGFGLAAVLLLLGPVALGNVYFAMRPDLLAVPLVVIGCVSLLFGVRALVAFVAPLLVALLSWPLPLQGLVEASAGAVTAATTAALRSVLHVLPLAAVDPGAGDLRLAVPGPDGSFDVVVASACSGITGITGTLLVAVAAQYVLHGTRRARLGWLAAAVSLAWVLNLVRILLLLWIGRSHGEALALGLFHPVAGLVLLNLGFAVLLVLAPRFGLRFSLHRPAPADTPLTRPAAPEHAMDVITFSRRVVVVAAAVGALAVLNTTLPGAAAAYGPSGAPAPVFGASSVAVPGFVVSPGEEQRWARRYFGGDSSWHRYRLTPATPATRFSVWADAITTSSWGALRAHPVIACYRFHDYELLEAERVVIAGGLLADEVVYRHPDGGTWHVLSWERPVRDDAGALRHERVTLLASSTAQDIVQAQAPPPAGLRAAVAARWGGSSADEDPNPSLAAALRLTAQHLLITRPGS